MPLIALLLVVSLAVVQGETPAVSLSDVDRITALYASAAYDDVLQGVEALPPDRVTAPIERCRALSLMALGRTKEAEQAFERMVRSTPLYQISEADVSPRVFGLFRDVRRRVLPVVAREMYAEAKSLYEQQHYEAAVTRFKSVLGLLADGAMAQPVGAFDDLKQLAEGFIRLAELETQLAARAAAAPVGTAGPVEPAIAVTKIVIYSASDTAVIPPVELERRMPPWAPPPIMARSAEYSGTLEVVIDEVGAVESAVMIRPTVPSYDVLLIDAARRWRYKSATFNNQSVKYRLSYNVVLSPRR